MAGKKAPDQVWVVIGTVISNYGLVGPTVQGAYIDKHLADEAAAGCGGGVQTCTVSYLTSGDATTSTASGDANSMSKTKTSKTPKTEKGANSESATKRTSTKTTIPAGIPGSLNGLKVAFTGTFRTMDYKTCEAATTKHGGETVNKLAESDFVVLGTNLGSKKQEEIDNRGLTTMTEGGVLLKDRC